ncbi:unnamed protein product [Pleuronectes platessa]|uniref:Uncharacterized protein n=1 Tax=Pleuronectes platessa TaxID=8262 RepID=A0A9N7Z856_PLEPL|nr:unnamed protein product [Pleuronectes platessa]
MSHLRNCYLGVTFSSMPWPAKVEESPSISRFHVLHVRSSAAPPSVSPYTDGTSTSNVSTDQLSIYLKGSEVCDLDEVSFAKVFNCSYLPGFGPENSKESHPRLTPTAWVSPTAACLDAVLYLRGTAVIIEREVVRDTGPPGERTPSERMTHTVIAAFLAILGVFKAQRMLLFTMQRFTVTDLCSIDLHKSTLAADPDVGQARQLPR